jgi:glycosyltransferase involved in cell wall biosynthesis
MSDRKKIALCLEYPLALRGGVSVLVETLIAGLADHHDLVLVSPDTQAGLAGSSVAPQLKQHIFWDPATPSVKTARQLARQLAESGVHLAHFHLGGNFGFGNRFPNQSPMSHLSHFGIPCCSTVHLVVHPLDGYCGPQKPLAFKLAMLPLAWLGKMHALAHVRREIAVSQHDHQKLRRWYRPLRGRFAQIYHSRLKAASRPADGTAREPMILNVGHIAARKGQVVLTEAFAQIAPKYPAWKLCLVGHVAEESAGDQIRQIAKKSKLEERILLAGARDDAFDWMSRAAIYAQPSLAEALGLALQEAMFRGCPAIGTRAGGIPELIQHQKTGLLVDAGSAPQLAQAIESFIANKELRETLGRAGAASIVEKGMTFEQMTANHIRLYESILRDN